MQPIPAHDAVTRLGGVARTADVERLSSRARVRTALRRGELVRVGHGRLGLPALERAARAAAAVNGYLSHVSAALHHGWEAKHVPDLPQLVLSRRNARQGEPADFIADVHVADVPPCDRDRWATSPLRTVLDCARGLPFSDALCVADSALRHGAVTPERNSSRLLRTWVRGYAGWSSTPTPGRRTPSSRRCVPCACVRGSG